MLHLQVRLLAVDALGRAENLSAVTRASLRRGLQDADARVRGAAVSASAREHDGAALDPPIQDA